MMTEEEKTRLNELRLKDRTDLEDKEFRYLEAKDTKEEVPVGTTTQKVEALEEDKQNKHTDNKAHKTNKK